MTRLHGHAIERIPHGAHVLCRNTKVCLADPSIANGIAATSKWHPGAYEEGEWVTVVPIEGLGERDLHAMANGPLMEPSRLYLPAGKISEKEYQERLALDFAQCGIARDER